MRRLASLGLELIAAIGAHAQSIHAVFRPHANVWRTILPSTM